MTILMAVAADRIAFAPDGNTAWWVRDDALPDSPSGWPVTANDRPCDTCDGKGYFGEADDEDGCWDCIGTGRHAFEIQVETFTVFDTEDGGRAIRYEPNTYRVSIVPGMVLPIVVRHPFGPMTHADGYVLYLPDGTGQLWQTPARNDGAIITLPLAAKPGMWAVQLKVSAPHTAPSTSPDCD